MIDENGASGEAMAQAPQEQERMLNQAQVNKLIQTAKLATEEQTRAKAEAEFQAKLAQLQGQKQSMQARGEDTREIDVDAVYQQVQERFNREMQERQLKTHMKDVADSYMEKMSGPKPYDDFDDVTDGFDPGAFPQIVYLVAKMNNAPEIVYELSKNPQKLAYIDSLAKSSPKFAQKELQKIGASIDANKQALMDEQQAKTMPPLNRMTPSLKTGSSGQMSIKDLRNQPWLKG